MRLQNVENFIIDLRNVAKLAIGISHPKCAGSVIRPNEEKIYAIMPILPHITAQASQRLLSIEATPEAKSR